jgi:hypothetical protein
MADQIDNIHPVHFEPTTAPTANTAIGKDKDMTYKATPPVLKVILALVIVLAGIGTGYALNQFTAKARPAGSNAAVLPQSTQEVKIGAIFGEKDSNSFPDNAEGVLVKGGIQGEGSHHLMRQGGAARNVYMTSSVLDLSLFENAKVKVWGETFTSQHAGWLMDVGRVEVEELNVEKPFDEGGQTPVLEGE